MDSLRFSKLQICAFLTLGVLAWGGFAFFTRRARAVTKPVTPHAVPAQLPVHFEPNQGQLDPSVRFQARGSGYQMFLTDTETIVQLRTADCGLRLDKRKPAAICRAAAIRWGLVGANSNAPFTPLDALIGKSNYFLGNQPDKWHTDVPHYAKVRRDNIYTGISLVYYNAQQQLEYDFIVTPRADPTSIKWHVSGVDKVSIDHNNGDLVLHTRAGTLRQHKPVAYQEINGTRREVTARYKSKVKNQKPKIKDQQPLLLASGNMTAASRLS